jgi:hypothetical protein
VQAVEGNTSRSKITQEEATRIEFILKDDPVDISDCNQWNMIIISNREAF